MKVNYGNGKTKYGPGVLIELSGDEVAHAINTYLVAHNIYVKGPRTITVNGNLCTVGKCYVDPSGEVIYKGKLFPGKGNKKSQSLNACRLERTTVCCTI